MAATNRRGLNVVVGLLATMSAAQQAHARETLAIASARANNKQVSMAVGADIGIHQRTPSTADVSAQWRHLQLALPWGTRAGFGVALGFAHRPGAAVAGLFAVDYASTLKARLQEAASDGTSVKHAVRYQDATVRVGVSATRLGSKVTLVGAGALGYRLSSYFSPVASAYVNHLRQGPALILTLGLADAQQRFFVQAKPEVAYLLPGADLKRAAGGSARVEGGVRVDLGLRLWQGFCLTAYGEEWRAAGNGSSSRTFGMGLSYVAAR